MNALVCLGQVFLILLEVLATCELGIKIQGFEENVPMSDLSPE